ncbi:MAG: hypothetical protein QGI83_25360 [Candidatus Latescibacteria bacterium]|jgi:hypothetical protein|nr:hypothetical protein [Candidatus Latescibacterota bacterium]
MKRMLLVGTVLLALTAQAYAGVGVTVKAGTLGIGAEVTKSIVPTVNVRVGGSYFTYGFDGTEGDVSYDLDLKLKSFNLLVDFHPILGRGLRLSAGMVLNSNGVDMVSRPTASYDIGGTTYTATDVGTIHGAVDFKSFAPYVGIGWGNAAGGRWGIAFDLGLALQGSPQVDLSATGPIASDAQFLAELRQEESQVQDDISGFKYYPVVSLGLSFKLSAM